jgi:arylsulfatase A-like enzyme
MGPRGDAIVQLDWCVGEILETLDKLGLTNDTMVIFTSDNGPAVDDGYKDRAVELLGTHKPSGPLRGGKYSAFDAGTRIPFIVRHAGRIAPGTCSALLCQIDMVASMATLTGQKLADNDAPDSFDACEALRGRSQIARDHLVEHAGTLSLIQGDWKYIEPSNKPKFNKNTNTELGNNPEPQLYNLRDDLGERKNIAAEYPDKVRAMAALLQRIRQQGRSRP